MILLIATPIYLIGIVVMASQPDYRALLRISLFPVVASFLLAYSAASVFRLLDCNELTIQMSFDICPLSVLPYFVLPIGILTAPVFIVAGLRAASIGARTRAGTLDKKSWHAWDIVNLLFLVLAASVTLLVW